MEVVGRSSSYLPNDLYNAMMIPVLKDQGDFVTNDNLSQNLPGLRRHELSLRFTSLAMPNSDIKDDIFLIPLL